MKTKRQIRHDFLLDVLLKVRENSENNIGKKKRKIKLLFITLIF